MLALFARRPARQDPARSVRQQILRTIGTDTLSLLRVTPENTFSYHRGVELRNVIVNQTRRTRADILITDRGDLTYDMTITYHNDGDRATLPALTSYDLAREFRRLAWT